MIINYGKVWGNGFTVQGYPLNSALNAEGRLFRFDYSKNIKFFQSI